MSDTQDAPEEPIDVAKLARTIVQGLQADPAAYRRFGVYWWFVKAMLRRLGYGPAQFYLLGPYVDPATAAQVPSMSLEDTIRAAIQEYAFNTTFPSSDGRVEAPDGELVAIEDEDAAL